MSEDKENRVWESMGDGWLEMNEGCVSAEIDLPAAHYPLEIVIRFSPHDLKIYATEPTEKIKTLAEKCLDAVVKTINEECNGR